MPIEGMTEQDLALLNPAERAIMEADDEDDLDAIEELAGDDKDDAPENAPESIAEPADEPETQLKFTAETPEDAAEQKTALQTRKSDAFNQLMSGELEPAAYQAIESEISVELEKLLQASITDSVTTKFTRAQAEKAWDAEVTTMIKTAATEGLDYKANVDMANEFDGLIKVFANEATTMRGMPDNNLQASKWALAQAHATMKMRHPELVKVDPSAPAGKARAKADLGAIPPSLKGAPIAAGASVGSEFSHMEGLVGAESEKAFARLTKDQQERWLDT